jgi:hypothetical protein
LIIAAHTQLRLARPWAIDLGRPWEKPTPAARLTPARVRRGFRNLREQRSNRQSTEPPHPGPGRPPGSKNARTGPHYVVGKNKHNPTSTERQQPQDLKIKL